MRSELPPTERGYGERVRVIEYRKVTFHPLLFTYALLSIALHTFSLTETFFVIRPL